MAIPHVTRIAGAALLLWPTVAMATIFIDGNDRKSLHELRRQETRTKEEDAILAAAPKLGKVLFCNNTFGGNAFLIRYRGRPAVVTSAHKLIGKNGEIQCGGSLDAYKEGMGYVPNATWYEPGKRSDQKFVWHVEEMEFPPVNWESIRHGVGDYDGKDGSRTRDFAIFYLKNDISADKLPDGSVRGYLEFAEEPVKVDDTIPVTMIATMSDIGDNREYFYQTCKAIARGGWFHFDCDVSWGASGGLVAAYEGGKLKFRGIVSAGVRETVSEPFSAQNGNVATSSDEVLKYLRAH